MVRCYNGLVFLYGMTTEDKAHAGASLDLRRSLWRSRRGMLELDLYLVPFATDQIQYMSLKEREEYAALLDMNDWQILNFLTSPQSAPESVRCVVMKIIEFRK